MKKKPEKFTKTSLMELKDLTIKEWRGIFTIIVLVLGFITITICASYGKDVIAIVITPISTIMLLVVEWYFKRSNNEEGNH